MDQAMRAHAILREDIAKAQNRLVWQNEALNIATVVFRKVFGRSRFSSPPTRHELQLCRNAAHLYMETSQVVMGELLGDSLKKQK